MSRLRTAPMSLCRRLIHAAPTTCRAVEHSVRRAMGLAPARHIAICGFPRSGTSLFCNMLGATLTDFQFDQMSERRSAETLSLRGNHVSKRPLDILETASLPAHNVHHKDIIVLILVRDPRDVITSVHENVPDQYFIGYDVGCRIWGEYPNYQSAMDHVGLGETFAAVQAARASEAFTSLLIRYEDLAADPDAVQGRLADELNLTFSGKFSQFHQRRDQHVFQVHGTKPMDPSLVKWDKQVSTEWMSRWRDPAHRPRITEQATRHPALLEMICELGYETDSTWFERYCDADAADRFEGASHAS